MTRAKFKVIRIESSIGSKRAFDAEGKEHWEPAELRIVVLIPVYSSDPKSENAKFWAASPSGEIKLGVINPEVWKEFELDKEYYIDFTLCPNV